MPVHPDLYAAPETGLKTIGYIGCNYPIGNVLNGFVEKLKIVQLWGMTISSPGNHICGICGNETSSSAHIAGGYQWPDMLIHYIVIHAYIPPAEFMDFIAQSGEADFPQERYHIPLPDFEF